MSILRRIDRLYRNRINAVKTMFLILVDTISEDELRANPVVRSEIEKILHQFELIEELDRSFEF